ncbi:MAG: hypothetical protein MZV70_12295 [Desulfobacterales bacterium]|nr:hypothetical protein [Desulfobacterales bacterium]
MSTTIGTSTNLLVVSVAADMGLRSLQMFDFLAPAALAGAMAIVYLWLVAPTNHPSAAILHWRIHPHGFSRPTWLSSKGPRLKEKFYPKSSK